MAKEHSKVIERVQLAVEIFILTYVLSLNPAELNNSAEPIKLVHNTIDLSPHNFSEFIQTEQGVEIGISTQDYMQVRTELFNKGTYSILRLEVTTPSGIDLSRYDVGTSEPRYASDRQGAFIYSYELDAPHDLISLVDAQVTSGEGFFLGGFTTEVTMPHALILEVNVVPGSDQEIVNGFDQRGLRQWENQTLYKPNA